MRTGWTGPFVLALLVVPVSVRAQADAHHWRAAQQAFSELDDRMAVEHLRRRAAAGDRRAVVAYGLFARYGQSLLSPTVMTANAQEARHWLSQARQPAADSNETPEISPSLAAH